MLNLTTFLRDSSVVALAISLAAITGGAIATNGRSGSGFLAPILCAVACCLLVFVPAIALRNLEFLGANRFLAALLWRFPLSLAVIPLIYSRQGQPRKYFVFGLMTCYFIALPLESWLQMRQAKRKTSLSECSGGSQNSES